MSRLPTLRLPVMIDDQVARGGVQKGARVLDVRGIGGREADECGLCDVFRLRRPGAELRPHVAAKPFPVNEIEVGELLAAFPVDRRARFEELDQALGDRVGHEDPEWKIVA